MTSWDDVVRLALALPETETSTWNRGPSLKVAGRSFARQRTESDGLVVLACSPGEKQALLQSGEPGLSTTPHYDGYDYILVDPDEVDQELLTELVRGAWWAKAPQRARRRLPDGFP
jgi:hypothetical protein